MARIRMGQKNAKHRQVERERAHTYLVEAIILRLLTIELDIFLQGGGLLAILLRLAYLVAKDEAVQAFVADQDQARRRLGVSTTAASTAIPSLVYLDRRAI